MNRFSALKRLCVLGAACVFSSSAMAGVPSGNGRIWFEPASMPIAVPTLTDGMLIALGIFLFVMAVRFMRDDRGTVKTVAAAFLTVGLVMGGHGIKNTLATDEHTIQSDECTVGGNHEFNADRINVMTNACPNAMQVTALQCVDPEYDGGFNDPCKVGTTIPGGGGQCDMPRCEQDGPI